MSTFKTATLLRPHWPWRGCATRRGSPCPGWWTRSAGTLCSSPPTAGGSCGPGAPAQPGDRAWSCHELSCTVTNCHKLSCCRDDVTDLAAAAWYCWAGGCRNLMTVPTMSRVTRRIRSMAEAMGYGVLGDGDGVFMCGQWSAFCNVLLWRFHAVNISVCYAAHTVLSPGRKIAYWPMLYNSHLTRQAHMVSHEFAALLRIFSIFVNYIEQRRLFFWVWCGILKNFARESSTSCLVLRPK